MSCIILFAYREGLVADGFVPQHGMELFSTCPLWGLTAVSCSVDGLEDRYQVEGYQQPTWRDPVARLFRSWYGRRGVEEV